MSDFLNIVNNPFIKLEFNKTISKLFNATIIIIIII